MIPAMFRCFSIVALLLGTANAQTDWSAYHRFHDADWAKRSGLKASEVAELRRLAGAQDVEGEAIDLIDAKRLGHGHILVVAAGANTHCLQVQVFKREKKTFTKLWEAGNEMPGGKGGFCRQSPSCLNPQAYAREQGLIQVIVPWVYDRLPAPVCLTQHGFVYRWTGTSYEFASQEAVRGTALDDYRSALDAAFLRAAETDEPLAMLELAPAFMSERAVVFRRRGEGRVEILRLTFNKSLWMTLNNNRCRECDIPDDAFDIEATVVPVDEELIARFLSRLETLDRRQYPRDDDEFVTDATRCRLRLPDGSIYYFPFEGRSWAGRPAMQKWARDLVAEIRKVDPKF